MSARIRRLQIEALWATLLVSSATTAQPAQAPARKRVVTVPWLRAGVSWADARGTADLDVTTRSSSVAGRGQTQVGVDGSGALLEVAGGLRRTRPNLQIAFGPQILTTVLVPHGATATRELDALRIRPGALSMTSLGLMAELQFGGRFGWDLGASLGYVWMSAHDFGSTDGSETSARLDGARGLCASLHTGPAWRFDEWQVGAKARWLGARTGNYMEGASLRVWALGLDVGRAF